MRNSRYKRPRDTKVFHASPNSALPRSGGENTRGLTSLFCIFIAGLLVLFLVLPRQTFSNEERRTLRSAPVLSTDTVFDGRFEDESEKYISDHFPLRLFFVGLNSYMNLATGRTLINGVYVGKNEWFMQEPVVLDEANLEANMSAVQEYAAALGVPATVLAVPATGYVMESELPDVHMPYEEMAIRQAAQDDMGGDTRWLDVLPALEDACRTEQVYYRTDHHWTTPGAYTAYVAWAQEHGLAPAARDEFTIESYGGFLGTTYAKVLLWNVAPDTVEIWQYPADVTVTTMDADNGMEPVVTNSFYDMDQLEGYDPYAVFFGGNHSVVRIENHAEGAAGRLLVVKDSYANSLLPFLARHYAEIVVIDPRYYRDIGPFLANEGAFDEVLFVYGTGQLVDDQDLGRGI